MITKDLRRKSDRLLEQWLLERFEEAFDTTVALRFTDEGRRRRDAQETGLVLEVVAHKRGAVTMSELESLGGTGLEAAVDAAQAGSAADGNEAA